jgi:hypothetical protein
MPSEAEISWSNFEASVTRVTTLAGLLLILNGTLISFAYFMVPVAPGSALGPDSTFKLGGVTLSYREWWLGLVVSLYLQWTLVASIFHIDAKVRQDDCALGRCKLLILDRPALLNPFCKLTGWSGSILSFMILVGFVVSVFMLNAFVLSGKHMGSLFEMIFGMLLESIFLVPQVVVTSVLIFRVDCKTAGRRYAVVRGTVIAMVVVALWIFFRYILTLLYF